MFVLGVYVVDVPDYPRAYAAYWLVMMILVVWLCVLAIKDMLHTRRMIAEWRRMREGLGSSGTIPSAASEEPPQ